LASGDEEEEDIVLLGSNLHPALVIASGRLPQADIHHVPYSRSQAAPRRLRRVREPLQVISYRIESRLSTRD
jgi:hypothetical protein